MPEPAVEPEAPRLRPFAAVLQEQRQGGAHSELTEGLAEVVTAVLATGKAGSVTLKLNVKPSKLHGAIEVGDDITVKVPEEDKGESLFFANESGFVSRKDPRQPELPLRKVEGDGADDDNDAGRKAGS
jgi:hypothetical protein